MRNSITSILCLIVASAALFSPLAPASATEPPVGSTAATNLVADTTTGTEGMTLSQDQIDALQASNPDATNDNKSFFTKATDFVADHAPFFIIGIIVLAAILAGILITRDRSRKSTAGAAAAGAAGSTLSAKELRRRKRAAAQQAREEERQRRKAGYDSRSQAAESPHEGFYQPSSGPASQAEASAVEAEKRAARGLPPKAAPAAASTAGATGTAAAPASEVDPAAPLAGGAIPAPPAPSQTAPAAAVQPQTPSPPVDPAPVPTSESAVNPDDTIVSTPAAGAAEEPPTAVDDLPDLDVPGLSPPGADAKVGAAAAAFSAGAAGGAVAGRTGSGAASSHEQRAEEATPACDPDVIAGDVAGAAAVDEAEPGPAAEADEGDRRLRAKVEEIKAGQSGPASGSAGTPAATPAGDVEEDLDTRRREAEAVQREIDELAPEPVEPIDDDLEVVHRRLEENRAQRELALQQAEERLLLIEERAKEAERRAAFAERLTKLNLEESEREQRLNNVLTGIDRAESRTRDAEARAEAAERAATAAFDSDPAPASSSDRPAAPDPEPESSAGSGRPESEATEPEAVEPEAPKPNSPFSRIFSSSEEPRGLNINTATFEELRGADLSVTQATRILAYRERFGGYDSIEDLEKVPGFPAELIEQLSDKITV